MYKIGILFQDREFEHDIYELIRAFYPGSEICSFYEEEEAGCDLYFRIEKQGDSCVIRYEDHENKGVTSAEFIEGQSSDALFLVWMLMTVRQKNVHMRFVRSVRILLRLHCTSY